VQTAMERHITIVLQYPLARTAVHDLLKANTNSFGVGNTSKTLACN